MMNANLGIWDSINMFIVYVRICGALQKLHSKNECSERHKWRKYFDNIEHSFFNQKITMFNGFD